MKKPYNFFSISVVTILIIYQNCLINSPLTWFSFLFSSQVLHCKHSVPLIRHFSQLSLIILLHILSSDFTDFADSLWLLCEIQPPCYNLSLLYILSQAANCCLEFCSFCSLAPSSSLSFSLWRNLQFCNSPHSHLLFFPLLWALKSWLIYMRNILIILLILLILSLLCLSGMDLKNFWELSFVMNSSYE